MRIAGLFAGIGGLERGLAEAGHEARAFAEVWAPAAAVLARRFADVPNLGDVREVAALPAHDLLTAGFPCQDLSQAGRTAGIGGAKSGLVDHVFRLTDAGRPAHVLLENVSFMLSLDRGAAMARLVAAFEERGYRWAYRIVDTQAFLPQRRRRVFFLASRSLDPAEVLFADAVEPPAERPGDLAGRAHGFYWTEGIRGLGWGIDCIPTLKNGSTIGIPSPPAILRPDGTVVTPDIRDAERLQGFPADWTAPATATSPAARLRWTLVGNAVSVPVAAWIGARLERPGAHDATRDRPFDGDGRWPPAARSIGTGAAVRRVAVEISQWPGHHPRAPLDAFLEHPGKPLSLRATSGFLERLGRTRLRLPPGFADRIADHLARMRGLAEAPAAAAE
ncbi:DNA (cytosine-5-)-methyltransferase [Siculibacillus lacustris]|uniref:Cytosine-specific methyltransferase n=1 Tax=Siculibacillus lacustris TaxID=1549641 RepID=A0A4V2KTY0_9HYPH|nr:DNA (cytosine-5-)-methyltransferase [Siculibacillus lacustris]TBW39185.1 DNA (cytosine-5-)-methyltransferase [Siculibacillus lacustris]